MNLTKKYLKEIQKRIPLSYKQKRKLLTPLTNTINEYIEEHPQANYDELIQQFGTPSEIANGIIDVSAQSISNSTHHQKKLVIFLTIFIVCLVLILCYSRFLIGELNKTQVVFIREEIVEGTTLMIEDDISTEAPLLGKENLNEIFK